MEEEVLTLLVCCRTFFLSSSYLLLGLLLQLRLCNILFDRVPKTLPAPLSSFAEKSQLRLLLVWQFTSTRDLGPRVCPAWLLICDLCSNHTTRVSTNAEYSGRRYCTVSHRPRGPGRSTVCLFNGHVLQINTPGTSYHPTSSHPR